MHYNRKKNTLAQRFNIFTVTKLLVVAIFIGILTGCEDSCNDESCIIEKIEEAEIAVSSLKERNREFQKLLSEQSEEYEGYYQELTDNLPYLGVITHKDFLLICEEKYMELCNSLKRSAILRNTINWFEEEIKKGNMQIQILEQNIWELNHKIEIGKVANSREQQKIVNRILAETKVMVEKNTEPTEDQDTGELEKTIFEEIMQ